MLTWIKGEPLPSELITEILKAIGLKRETLEQRLRSMGASPEGLRIGRSFSSVERYREAESYDEDSGSDDHV